MGGDDQKGVYSFPTEYIISYHIIGHLGSARVSERDEKEETTDVALLF